MGIAVQQIRPVAHLPLVLAVSRHLKVASLIDDRIPPHPAPGLSTGRGVETMVLAILDHMPPHYVVAAIPAQCKQPAVRIGRLSLPSDGGTRPPSPAPPHLPALRARRWEGSRV